ncbi:hypothetical protein [Edaphobacter albus]|uniref:hypothetical protein n=1 Tax=Edaphobacter sp. 4G125 TaxID=2763071 RepID=UPI00164758E6|nr:hypothetical protein [Edaphobacter sp. 4G125]QNI38190.1 hypothetical protein H7846_08095 [Edaphobacter sp. 4G125]
MKKLPFVLLVSLAAVHLAPAQQQAATSPLGFTSSVPSLAQSFAWAKSQALEYSRTGVTTIGPWYEAALPGRNAFCMRDVSHQTGGAAALGLYTANKNMLRRFAQSAVESRDWAAYWEIDGEGRPSAADYISDTNFWFNLPANFDVLDASTRMWRWTGDDSYRYDPAFQRFFRITTSSYIKAWQLAPKTILHRPRIANRRQAEGRFVQARGIPSYSEGTHDFIFGADLLAAEYRALNSFQEINVKNTSLVKKMREDADAVQSLLERVAWSEHDAHYLGTIRKDLSGYGSGDALVLYFAAAKDPAHIRGALGYLSSPSYWSQINIEEESYLPLILFRYGRNQTAYQVLTDLSAPHKQRREYPEVSYAVIEAIVSGVMGVIPGTPSERFDLSTFSRLPENTDSATLTSLSIKKNQIDVTHKGTSSTSLKNNSGPLLRWRAQFPGNLAYLKVDGKRSPAHHTITSEGLPISWTDIAVAPGATILVESDPICAITSR